MISCPENRILPILPFDEDEENKLIVTTIIENSRHNHDLPLYQSFSDDNRVYTMKRCNIIELDHDSLDSILSYCPNRGSYEIQSLRITCRLFNNVFRGNSSLSSSSLSIGIQTKEESIAASVKEAIRSQKLLERIESVYLPRLYFQIFIPGKENRNNSENIETSTNSFIEIMEKILGSQCRRLSEDEIEYEFNFNDNNLLDDLESIMSGKSIDDCQPLNSELATTSPKLFYYNKGKELLADVSNHIGLRDLYGEWMQKPLIDKNMKMNPFRLCRKTILHFQFKHYALHHSIKDKISCETSIVCTENRRHYVFLNPKPREEISFYYGKIYQEYDQTYCFEKSSSTRLDKCRVVIQR
ncbi:hypothetical protein NAEGRDRAFT_78976 [Naegleria gruberi]|uniref:Uncharacterized protein n=1 Tax=Naegleria gruberi TaxID=5762 RepID=D2V8A2_NAEGR|nr:uncharacterized protein NAEGRDRAFT_78976 [Naegleria gruberi]EFC47142.1 hypothetical protein NAEGRDRAFT_78976 [Naegleria gruberi]|eukprot:XP_002679886.1 hypothetical protein NAEGRDRAFT_78976 [Naegleria gruberi strain NEG-M]